MKNEDTDFLGEFEQTVMLAALRQPDGTYAVTIREEIESRTGRNVSRGAIYVTLDRLEKKGYLESWLADPTPERGGRAKRYYKINQLGMEALTESWNALNKMWHGLDPTVRKI